MVDENHHRREAGSLRRNDSSVKPRLSDGSSVSNSDGGVVSRVLGSIRRRRRDKPKPLTPAEIQLQQRRLWIANYQGSHSPDRPQVDRRMGEKLSDNEYARKLQRMQERNERIYASADRSQSRGRGIGRSRTAFEMSTTLSEGRSSVASGSTSEERPSLQFSRTEWPIAKEGSTRGRAPSSPISPGAVTIQVYRDIGGIDRGPIIRYRKESEQRAQLLSNKLYAPSESSQKGHSSQEGSRQGSTGTSIRFVDIKTPTRDDPNSTTPSLILNSSTTSPYPKDIYSSPKPKDNNHKGLPTPPLEPAQRCPWPGCNSILRTEEEKKDNLCTDCHETLYPRESAFFGSNEEQAPPAAGDAELASLQALVGARAKANTETAEKSTQEHTTRKRTVIPRVDSKFSTSSFKLQPAPRGKRQRSPGSSDESENRRDVVRSPPPSSRNKHIGFQDVRWFPLSPKEPSVKYSPPPKPKPQPRAENNDSRIGAGLLRPESRKSSDDSWTTDLRCSDNDSDDSSEDALSNLPKFDIVSPPKWHLEDKERHLEDNKHKAAPLPGRQTVLYQEIDDIIDCYTTIEGGMKITERQQKRADTVSSFFEREPEEIEMKRRGFI
ncbi:uncharacterized protein F4822DRAFT_168091 [Hypoxylon trugodes]|uniref:uncharacterized protein n=1 Tax=Hypoxylon trugodes TaxID=326681 RepID=UPI002191F571|nr:uncharacterized protein F4822DRAFT_168091 [Hypoxylon trugodes]KAI1390957.1 hypothetical protein F4822DRAFT_168091 [Hypoxylon trugodes]